MNFVFTIEIGHELSFNVGKAGAAIFSGEYRKFISGFNRVLRVVSNRFIDVDYDYDQARVSNINFLLPFCAAIKQSTDTEHENVREAKRLMNYCQQKLVNN